MYNKGDMIQNEVFRVKISDIKNLEELKEDIENFNSSKDLVYKYTLAPRIIENLGFNIFGVCRICGGLILYSHTMLHFRKPAYVKEPKFYKINIVKPAEYERKIEGKIYKLSCCEKCLLKEFKKYPPKTRTLMFSRGQRWSKFVYNVPEDVAARLRSNTVAVTLESMIRKHGEEEGRKRWEHYCNAQSISNTFEYKQEKYGWTRKEFDKFNKSRAVTLVNLQKKYGKEEGKRRFEEYCARQSYTNSLDYMIEAYGEKEGTKKFEAFCKARVNFNNGASYESQRLFDVICSKLNEHNIDTSKIYYSSLDRVEKYAFNRNAGVGYYLDYYDENNNIAIEFQGDYWHANPLFCKPEDVNYVKHMTSKEIWECDNQKEAFFKSEFPGITYIRVWEHDFNTKPIEVLNDILKHYNISLNFKTTNEAKEFIYGNKS